MALRNTLASYGSVAKTLHWLIAATVFALLIVGFLMGNIENSTVKGNIYNIHKLTGLMVLLLMCLRITWASSNTRPRLPESTTHWERIASHSLHHLLYVILLAMPISGWVMSCASGYFPHIGNAQIALPLLEKNKALASLGACFHQALAWLIVACVALHVMAAFKHHFIHKDAVLARMLPGKNN